MAEPAVAPQMTFGDIKDQFEEPKVQEFDPLAPPEPAQAAPVAPPPAPAPAPVAPPPAPVAPPQPTFAEQMAAYQYAQQQAMAQAQQEQEWRRQAEAMYTPPPIPDENEVLTDPKRWKEDRERLANWAANLQRQNQAWTAQAFQEMQNRIAQGQMQAMSLAAQTRATDEIVASKLAEKGYSNVAPILVEVDRALQQNPQNYMNLRLDPTSVQAAAEFILMKNGAQPQPVVQGVASNPNMPYSRGTQGSASGSPASNSAALKAAEARLGRRISPKYAERFGNSHNRGV